MGWTDREVEDVREGEGLGLPSRCRSSPYQMFAQSRWLQCSCRRLLACKRRVITPDHVGVHGRSKDQGGIRTLYQTFSMLYPGSALLSGGVATLLKKEVRVSGESQTGTIGRNMSPYFCYPHLASKDVPKYVIRQQRNFTTWSKANHSLLLVFNIELMIYQ
ncbi:hypothetical protein NFI96_007940 [Prochilodus magdalenae]|nr:hypothetical protein NFI96_007940 [Prochilodus magdalenae]